MSHFDRIDILCARRVQDARERYGCLDLSRDQRNFRVEAQEEILDTINYTKFGMARGEISVIDGKNIIQLLKVVYRMLL